MLAVLNEKKEIEDELMANVYQKLPIQVVKGKGAIIWDSKGKEYIDCMAGYGVAIVGHCNPKVVEAIKKQAERLVTCHCSLYNDVRAELLEKISKITPKGLSVSYLANSGAEAVEAAIKLAIKHSGKHGLISMTGSYHGKTFGALSATWDSKYRKPYEPLISGFKFARYGDLNSLKEKISDDVSAIIVEPIQGESGIHLPPPNYLKEVRELTRENDILMIVDEIQSGFGRTGKVWAFEHYNIIPDIICSAKGLGGGLPIGATISTREIMNSFKIGDHTSTFGGNPLSCASACAAIEYLIEERLPERAGKIGKYFLDMLYELKEKHRMVRDVRGLGLMIGMELRFDVRNIILDGIKNGVLLLYAGRNVLRFLPPLVITEEQIKKVVEVLDKLLSEEEKRRGLTNS